MTTLFTMENIELCLTGIHPTKSLGMTRQVELCIFAGNSGVFELRTEND